MRLTLTIAFLTVLTFELWGQKVLKEFIKCTGKYCATGETLYLNNDGTILLTENSDRGRQFMIKIRGTWKATSDSSLILTTDTIRKTYIRKLAFETEFLLSTVDLPDWKFIIDRLSIIIQANEDIISIGKMYGLDHQKKAIKKMMDVLLYKAWGERPRDIFADREGVEVENKKK